MADQPWVHCWNGDHKRCGGGPDRDPRSFPCTCVCHPHPKETIR